MAENKKESPLFAQPVSREKFANLATMKNLFDTYMDENKGNGIRFMIIVGIGQYGDVHYGYVGAASALELAGLSVLMPEYVENIADEIYSCDEDDD